MASFDYAILKFMHSLALKGGDFFTPFFKFISLLGEKGIVLLLIGFISCLFRKTRRFGITLILSVAIGFVINKIIKIVVQRERPFYSEPFSAWWQDAGRVVVDEYSFPSGHTTAMMAAMTALFLCFNKKWSFLGFFAVVLMGASRNYLMVHYPTDVLGGVLLGLVAGIIAYYLIKFTYNLMEKRKDKKFFNFILNASIVNLFKHKSVEVIDKE